MFINNELYNNTKKDATDIIENKTLENYKIFYEHFLICFSENDSFYQELKN